jgi:hypothetical protein
MECPCKPDFTYKTKTTFNTHLKSDTHKLYQLQQDLNTAQARILQLEMDMLHKNTVERTLINQINGYEMWVKNLNQK